MNIIQCLEYNLFEDSFNKFLKDFHKLNIN